VQPGIDFNDWRVAPYQPTVTEDLSACHARLPGHLTFEVHATDYQTPDALHKLVRDHFTLLKVGPCLTFAFREVVYALAQVEEAWPGIRFPSNIRSVMDSLMSAHPEHLSDQQCGLSEEHYFARHFSYRDRIRYYWSRGEAMSSFNRLLQNLSRPLPASLLRQFLPDLYPDIEAGLLEPDPRLLIRRRIRQALEPYVHACKAHRIH
jgi:D-tagatose-1,6-bisphosphate aldolase subunit GatZ/KbaZ